jgi:hypothetical protein
VKRIGGETSGVAEFCTELPAPVKVACEAGPTGFGLARALAERGIDCTVAAPGKAPPRTGQDRPSRRRAAGAAADDRRASLRSGADPSRRGDARSGEGVRGRARWTQRHLDWLGRVELPEPVAQSVLLAASAWCHPRARPARSAARDRSPSRAPATRVLRQALSRGLWVHREPDVRIYGFGGGDAG